MAMQLKMIGALLALAIFSLAHAAGGANIALELNDDTDIQVYLPDLRMTYFPAHPKFILFRDEKNGDQRLPVHCAHGDVNALRGRMGQPELAAKVVEFLKDDPKGLLKDDLAVCFNWTSTSNEIPPPPFKSFPGAITRKEYGSDRAFDGVDLANTSYRLARPGIFSFQNTDPNRVSLPAYYATLMNHRIFIAIFGKNMLEVGKEKRAGQ